MNKELQRIKEQFEEFMDGYRMIMLTQRSKEGGKVTNPDKVSKRRISKHKAQFLTLLEEFLETKEMFPEKQLRIYSCVNERDINKGIRLFKQRQLDADYFDEDSKNSFYLDIKNRWMSALMSPKSKGQSRFLIDIDNIIGNKDDISFVEKHIQEIKVEVLLKYQTKNGWHIITEPFNPALWNDGFGDIKRDALLLLSY